MESTGHFPLPTVPAATPVTPSSKGLSPLRALAGIFVWVAVFGLDSLGPEKSYAAVNSDGVGAVLLRA